MGGVISNPVARTIPFDNSTNELLSTNAQDATEEVGPYSVTLVAKDISIPTVRQMSVYQEQEIEDGFEVQILGELVIYE
jgi:hypothetical protein